MVAFFSIPISEVISPIIGLVQLAAQFRLLLIGHTTAHLAAYHNVPAAVHFS